MTNLITANSLPDVIQRVNDVQSQALPLLVFRHGDVFDVAYPTEVVDTVFVFQSAWSLPIRNLVVLFLSFLGRGLCAWVFCFWWQRGNYVWELVEGKRNDQKEKKRKRVGTPAPLRSAPPELCLRLG